MVSRAQILLNILALTWFLALVYATRQWGTQQLFPPHRIPENALSPRRSVVRRKIVLYHNFFRTKVRPTASNMLNMSWHGGAAKQAQQHAERCVFLKHNRREDNFVPRLGECGQSIFVSTARTPWFFAVKSWFLEYRNFTYGDASTVRDLMVVGHYTNLAWATSFKVGCGLAYCKGGPWGHFYNYVCHYCPGGNINTITQYPYKAGKPCADCPHHCVGGFLCSNYCYYRDVYNNCDELMTYGRDELCRSGNCNATCACGNERIHKNFPW